MTDTPFDESASPPEPEEPPAETSPSSTSVSTSRRSSNGEAADSLEPPSEPRRRDRWLVAVLAAGLVVVLAAVGLVGTRVIGVWGADPDPTPEATASPEPTEPPSPFDGTPAENFAEGAAGIVLPEAEAVGDFTADEVAEALEQVRAALIAARLDSSMLVDHDPELFLELLAADQQSTVDTAFSSDEFGTFATQVATDSTLTSVPRVEGRISYTPTTDGGLPVLEVNTRFVWVYAFDTTDVDPGADLVVVRDELVWWVRFHELWVESSQGLWMPSAASRAWGADCDAFEDGLLRPDHEVAPGSGEGEGVIFDPEQPLDSDDIC